MFDALKVMFEGKKTYLLVLAAVGYYMGGAMLGHWDYATGVQEMWSWLAVGTFRAAVGKV